MDVCLGGVSSYSRLCRRNWIDRAGGREDVKPGIVKYTEPWTMVALVFVVFSGLMLFLAQPEIYLQRAPYVLNERFMFLLKMSLLATAVLYNFTVHRRVAKMDNPPPALSKLVAAVSLVLWVSIVFGGIFIGFLQ